MNFALWWEVEQTRLFIGIVLTVSLFGMQFLVNCIIKAIENYEMKKRMKNK
jgi:hypothetical protein